MRPNQTVAKAFVVLLHPDGERLLCMEWSDPSLERGTFHRVIGGHVDFQERFRDAAIREVKEEVGIDIEPDYLGWLENIYTYDGRPGHEVAQVFMVRLDHTPVPDEGGWLVENGKPARAVWRPFAEPGPIPLYPHGLAGLIMKELSCP